MLTRILLLVSATGLASVGCIDSAPISTNPYGTYTPVAVNGSAHFFEGDIVTLTAEGYRHVRFSDEIGPWHDDPPFQEYGGEAIYDDNKVIFVESWLDPPERYIVQVRRRVLLLTPAEYGQYASIGKLPEYSLQKREDEISQ